jgi:hypothetical protein
MATIIYVRKGSKAYNTASSREVSVADVLHLYGSEPSRYTFMKETDSPDIHADRRSAKFFSDPAHVVVKIDPAEIDQDIFPRSGFYFVDEAKPQA